MVRDNGPTHGNNALQQGTQRKNATKKRLAAQKRRATLRTTQRDAARRSTTQRDAAHKASWRSTTQRDAAHNAARRSTTQRERSARRSATQHNAAQRSTTQRDAAHNTAQRSTTHEPRAVSREPWTSSHEPGSSQAVLLLDFHVINSNNTVFYFHNLLNIIPNNKTELHKNDDMK